MLRAFLRRWWPALRLRTILLAVLIFVALLPLLGAVFLRGYENTLVRQTQAELIAQGSALAATAEALWPGAAPQTSPPDRRAPGYYRPEALTLDLSASPVLPERPAARPAPALPADPDAAAAALRLDPILEQTSRTTLASIVVLDRLGRVMRGAERGSYGDLIEVKSALGGTPLTVFRRNGAYQPEYSFEWLSRASALRIHHARPIVVRGEVVGVLLLSRSPRALFRGVYEDRGKILLGLGAILAVLVVLAGVVSRGVARPIETLSAAAREVAAGHVGGEAGAIPPVPITAALEIRTLFEDFAALAEAIGKRSRYLRDFAAAVSHEFKTPLAGIAGAAEILQDHQDTMSPAERRRFLANISADTARLSHLVTRLLDMARADMARPQGGVATAPEPPIRRAVDAAQVGGLRVSVQLPQGLPEVSVPAAVIEAVLTTLMENSRQAGAGWVDISANAEGGGLVVTVRDDGAGVPQADRHRLFEPFFTSHRSEGGTGMGLPIARSLLGASNARIVLVDSSTGARFDVTLPLANAAQSAAP